MIPTLEGSKYTYVVAETPVAGLSGCAPFGPLVISYSADLSCRIEARDGRKLALIGLCVDAHGEIPCEEIPAFLLDRGADIEAIAALSDRLAGRFVVVYADDGGGTYAFTDAAATLHVNYATDGRIALSSCEALLAKLLGLSVSPNRRKLWDGCAPTARMMPNDLTLHEGIRFLLPNHYLVLPDRTVRYFPRGWRFDKLEPKAAAALIAPLMRNCVRGFAAQCELISGLTAGYDSRLVYALLREAVEKPHCYTYINPGFTEKTPDLYIPRQLSEKFGFAYRQIPRETAPDAYRDVLRTLCGDWIIDSQINTAYTYANAGYADKTHIGGALIDQIGRDHVADGRSHRFAGEGFIIAVARNYDREAWVHSRAWCREAGADRGSVSLVDLYALEMRCGRWSTTPPMVHALAGNAYLNIFSCRELLKIMMRVPSRKRYERALQVALYEIIAPELLSIPFNPPRTFKSRMKRTRFYTFLAQRVGFAMKARRYGTGR